MSLSDHSHFRSFIIYKLWKTTKDYQAHEVPSGEYDEYKNNYENQTEGRIYENGFESLGKDATLPPPVELTQRFQSPLAYESNQRPREPGGYDSTLEMPSPPISPIHSPLKPYSYPAPSPSPQFELGPSTPNQESTSPQNPLDPVGIISQSGNISSSEAANMNYPNVKYYKNNGINVGDFKEFGLYKTI